MAATCAGLRGGPGEAMLWTKANYHWCWAWDHLVIGSTLRPGAACLRDFGSLKYEPRQSTHMEMPLEKLGWACKLGGVGSQGSLRSLRYDTCLQTLWVEGLEKEHWPLLALLFERKMPSNPGSHPSVPPCISLVSFKLLPQCWNSERWSSSKSGPSPLRSSWNSRSPLSHNPHWFVQPEIVGNSLLATGTLGWEAWCRARIPGFSGGTSAAEVSLPIFIHHTWVWDQHIPHLCPS